MRYWYVGLGLVTIGCTLLFKMHSGIYLVDYIGYNNHHYTLGIGQHYKMGSSLYSPLWMKYRPRKR